MTQGTAGLDPLSDLFTLDAFTSRLAPARLVASLFGPEPHRLHRALRDVLGHVSEGHHGHGG